MRSKLVVPVLLLLTFFSFVLRAEEPGRTREWHRDMTAVVLRDTLPDTRDEVIAVIHAEGGTVVLEADGALIGWMSANVVASLMRHPAVAAASQEPLRVEDLGLTVENAKSLIGYFNWVATGAATRDLDTPREIVEFVDRSFEAAVPSHPVRMGKFGRITTDSVATRDKFHGSILVNLTLIQSSGLPTTPTHTWSEPERADAFNRVADSMAWWRSRYHAQFSGPFTWRIEPRNVSQSEVEMANTTAEEHNKAIAAAMRAACSELYPGAPQTQCPWWTEANTPNSAHVAVDEFNDRTRELANTDSAFTIFLAYNPPGSPGVFGGNEAGYAAGPDVVAPYRPARDVRNLSPVIAHETGHIFGACDEYAGGCSSCAPCGRRNIPNGNCHGAPSGGNECLLAGHDRRRCIMTNDFSAYDAPTDELTKACPYTRMQIGWWQQQCFADVPWDIGSDTSWQGEYFDHLNPAATEVAQLIRNDGTGFLDKSFGTGAPGTTCLTKTDNFAVRWKRKVAFSNSVFTFTIDTDEGFALYVDNTLVLQSTTGGVRTVDYGINSGMHEVRFEYFDTAGEAHARLQWAAKGGTQCTQVSATVASDSNACPNGTGTLRLSVTGGTGPWNVSLRNVTSGETHGYPVGTPGATSVFDHVVTVPVGAAGAYGFQIVNVSDSNGCPGNGTGIGEIRATEGPRFVSPGRAEARTNQNTCQVNVTWPRAESCRDGSGPVVYNIVRNGTVIERCLPASQTSYTDRGVVEGTVYRYVVVAEDDQSGQGGTCRGGLQTFLPEAVTLPTCFDPVHLTVETIDVASGKTQPIEIIARTNAGPLANARLFVSISGTDLGPVFTDDEGRAVVNHVWDMSAGFYNDIVKVRFAGTSTLATVEVFGDVFVNCGVGAFLLQPEKLNVRQEARTYTVAVQTGRCSWTPVSSASWLTVSSTSTTGSGSFEVAVAGTTAARTGEIEVGGRKLIVEQSTQCTARFSETLSYLAATGPVFDDNGPNYTDVATLDVNAPSDCAWVAKGDENAPWLQLVAPNPNKDDDPNTNDAWVAVAEIEDSGPGTVTFRALSNSGQRERSAELEVVSASSTHTASINQHGRPICRAPQILIEPIDGTVDEGQNIAVRVHATGTDLRYDWIAAGELRGVRASSQIIIGPDHHWYPAAGDNETYILRVWNDCGSDGAQATWSVRPKPTPEYKPPFIWDHPNSHDSPAPGSRMELHVSAGSWKDCNGPFSYKWYAGFTGDRRAQVGTDSSTLVVFPDETSFYWVEVTDSCGPQLTGTSMVRVTGFPKRRAASHDLNNDGHSDVLWHNPTTKQNMLWEMNRTTHTGTRTMSTHADAGAQMQSVGDFNADSKPDVIFRNPQTGQNSVWLMRDWRIDEQKPLASRPEGQWTIGGAGDFDGDEHHDIVWHNNATGENEIWFHEETAHVGTWALPRTPDANWRLYGAADFNDDERPDLFFHDHRTGANSVWMMEDAVVASGRTPATNAHGLTTARMVTMAEQNVEPLPDTNWVPSQIADMDGDEQPDIVWRNKTTGANMVWKMDGTTKQSVASVETLPDLTWEIGGPATGAENTGGGTVPEERAATSLSASATNASFGGTTVITAMLTSNGAPLAGRAVEFRVNGVIAAEVLTDHTGTAVVAASVAGLASGTHDAIEVQFAGDASYAPSSTTTSITIGIQQPVIAWNDPAPIAYGTLLGASQLNATANVAGAFVYTPAAGALLDSGYHTLRVTFTPSDAAYASVERSVLLLVERAAAPVAWAQPAAITYGTALSSAQLAATASVEGTFTYEPAHGTLLDVGNGQTLRATFTPADPINHETATVTTTIDVMKGQQRVHWTPPSLLSYGQPLTAAELVASVSTSGPAAAGALTFNPAAGTVLAAGTHTLTATAAETAHYPASSASTEIVVLAVRPQITWPLPASIVYGTPLGASQLNAAANVAGSFTYTPAAGTVLAAGTHTLTVRFTPSDTANYAAATETVTLEVVRATPLLSWPQPASIVYGTPLGTSQLDASANVAGTFVYTPAAGTILNAGPAQTLSVAFTPNDTHNYEPASATVKLDVAKATQTLTWSSPAPIVYGTALDATQLNAQVQVVGPAPAGALTYAPPAGTILQAGAAQTLTVTAAATPNYESAQASVPIDVLRAKPQLSWPQPAAIVYGTPLGAAQLNATANVAGSFVYTPAAGTILEAGIQLLSTHFTPSDTRNYEDASATATLEVQQATPVLTWTQPSGIVYGTALSSAQLNATADVAGTFAYTPAAGTILDAGAGQTLSVHFTPSDTRNYKHATASVTIDVAKATQQLTWTPPAPIVYGTPLGAAQLNARVEVVGPAAAGALVYTPSSGVVLDAGAAQTLTVVAQETPNYEPATLSMTIDVARAPLSLRADAKSKLYGGVLPQLTGTLTGVVNGDPITASYATTATQQSAAGIYPITASLVDPQQRLVNYDVTIVHATLTVIPAPLVISANPHSKQYSDPLPQLTATFTGLVLGETPAVLGGVLSLQTTATRLSAPGEYPIAIGGLTSPNYAIVYVGSTFTVTQEDARVAITSPLLFVTASSSTTVTLSATVKDISATADVNGDTDAGDIRKATLTFVDRGTNTVLCTAPIDLIAAADERVGAATCSFTTDIGTAASTARTIGATIGGFYTRDDASDDAMVAITRPTNDFLTGGGAVFLGTSIGSRAADAGTNAAFQINLQYQKSGTVKGHLTLTFTRTENGAPRKYQIAAASIGSLAVRRTAGGGTAVIMATGVLSDVTIANAPVVIDATAPLIVTVTDGGEPARNADTLSVALLKSGGGLWIAGGWDGTRATEQPLREGNLAVHYAK